MSQDSSTPINGPTEEGGREPRDSIWSIRRKHADTFFATLFTLWTATAMAVSFAHRIDHSRPENQHAAEYITRAALEILIMMGPATIAIVVVAMILTPPLTIAGGAIVITYESLKARWVTPVIERHEARGEARGEARANQRWNEWWERRQEAESNNLPFDEPPPSSQS